MGVVPRWGTVGRKGWDKTQIVMVMELPMPNTTKGDSCRKADSAPPLYRIRIMQRPKHCQVTQVCCRRTVGITFLEGGRIEAKPWPKCEASKGKDGIQDMEKKDIYSTPLRDLKVQFRYHQASPSSHAV